MPNTLQPPRTGEPANRRVSDGPFVEIGQPLASIASCAERVWVGANFKETQIGGGQGAAGAMRREREK